MSRSPKYRRDQIQDATASPQHRKNKDRKQRTQPETWVQFEHVEMAIKVFMIATALMFILVIMNIYGFFTLKSSFIHEADTTRLWNRDIEVNLNELAAQLSDEARENKQIRHTLEHVILELKITVEKSDLVLSTVGTK